MNNKLLKENMSKHLITIAWDESIERAYRLLKANEVRHLPVHSNSGEIIGILSDRDVQRAMISRIEPVAGRVTGDETIDFDPNSRVSDYMSWPPKSVDQNADLKLVAEKMIIGKISALLVVNGEKIVGIVTTEDMLKVLLELLSDSSNPLRWTLERLMPGFQPSVYPIL